MTLKQKITALLIVLIFGSGMAVLAFMTFDTQTTLRGETERYSETIAEMLARLAGVSEIVVDDVEDILDNQMLAQAEVAAHLVAAAEKAGETQEEIQNRLRAIVSETDLDEFWITDEQGCAYLTNTDIDFCFSPDPLDQPQAYVFWPLLTGEEENVAQEAQVREVTDDIFKYVGTQGIDMPRIVQVGYNFEFMQRLENRIGLNRLIETIITDRRVNSIWVFNEQGEQEAYSSVFDEAEAVELAAEDREMISAVLASGQSALTFEDTHIRTITPIIAVDDDRPLGVTLIHFPIDALQDIQQTAIEDTLILGVIALLVAIAIAALVGGQLSRPILALTNSVRALYGGSLALAPLEAFTGRKDELGVFVREFKRMAVDIHRREEELDRLVTERTAELEAAQQQIRDEVALASRFQVAILPESLPPHSRFTGRGFMRPAKEMGGDFYDIFVIDENRVGMVIADVSGKGVPAAFFMAVSRTELRNEGIGGDDPAEVLKRVNDRLCGENPLNLFVTVFYAVFDHSNGILKYSNGGHNPPYIIHADGKVETVPMTGDLLLGIMEEVTYHGAELRLKPGDILYLYTDGICEAFNPEDEEFTNQRMEVVLGSKTFTDASDVIDSMLSAVQAHVRDAVQSDDITCLALQYTREGDGDDGEAGDEGGKETPEEESADAEAELETATA